MALATEVGLQCFSNNVWCGPHRVRKLNTMCPRRYLRGQGLPARSNSWVLVFLCLSGVGGCASSRSAEAPSIPTIPPGRAARSVLVTSDTLVLFIADSTRSAVFPILPDSARQSAGRIAEPSAPQCPAFPAPDTNSWQRRYSQTPSIYVDPISLQLPPEFDTLRLPPDPDNPDFPESGPSWEHGMGSWWSTATAGARQRPSVESFAIWIGPDSGYPDYAVSPAPTQVSLQECQLSISEATAHVAIYELADSAGTITRNMSAYWKVKDGVWLRAVGEESERTGAPDFLFVLRSLRVRQR